MGSSKIIHIVLAIVFLLFAVIQLNDPDPIQWFLLYFFVSILFVYSNYRRISDRILLILVVLYLAYSGWYFSYFMDWTRIEHKEELFGKMVYEKPYLEGTREFLGLLIAAAGLFYLYRKAKKNTTLS